MFAVIRTGGKQYTVNKDDVLVIDRIEGDEGAKVTFGEVLMLGGDKPRHGAPLISGAKVAAEIVKQGCPREPMAIGKTQPAFHV